MKGLIDIKLKYEHVAAFRIMCEGVGATRHRFQLSRIEADHFHMQVVFEWYHDAECAVHCMAKLGYTWTEEEQYGYSEKSYLWTVTHGDIKSED